MIDGLYSVKIGGDDAPAILEARMYQKIENIINQCLIKKIYPKQKN